MVAVLVLGLLILFEASDLPVPLVPREEANKRHGHTREATLFTTAPWVGCPVGSLIPHFKLQPADGTAMTLTDLLESGKPTFIYFWATT